MTLETDIGCLKSLPLFREMPTSRLKLLALMGERLRFAPGTVLVGDAQRPDGVYVVLQGEVEYSQDRDDGAGTRFRKEAGSLFGDVALLSGERFRGRVSARTEVQALRIPRDLFFELLQTVPEFSLAICRDLATRVARLANVVLGDAEPVA